MAKVTYVDLEGLRHEVEVSVGQSVMHAAIMNNIDGVEAECGGACSCATCHVYLDSEAQIYFAEADEMEIEMLESVADERKDNSRLSCQLVIESDTPDLIVYLPGRQY